MTPRRAASAAVKDRDEMSYAKWAKRVQRYMSHLERLFTPDLFVVGGGVSKDGDKWIPLLDLQAPVRPAQLLNNAGHRRRGDGGRRTSRGLTAAIDRAGYSGRRPQLARRRRIKHPARACPSGGPGDCLYNDSRGARTNWTRPESTDSLRNPAVDSLSASAVWFSRLDLGPSCASRSKGQCGFQRFDPSTQNCRRRGERQQPSA